MKIEFYENLFENSEIANIASWNTPLHKILSDIFAYPSHGHFNQWLSTINQLAPLSTNNYSLDQANVSIGKPEEIDSLDKSHIETLLKSLLPWRKGPFNFFGMHIDSEWRCDQKWQRVQSVIPSLSGKTVLDVGCGNGYYMLRMLGAGAKTVIGVDPTLIFLAQYHAITQNICNPLPAYLLPIAFERLPHELRNFDVVFSMGVLYHRREPMQHLNRLFAYTQNGGQLVLETLIIENTEIQELIPKERYAGMRNVWSIPSAKRLSTWLKDAGFKNIQLVNIQTTNIEEQRATEWSKNYSLENFLDTEDSNKTIEGYPAPKRAIFLAEKN